MRAKKSKYTLVPDLAIVLRLCSEVINQVSLGHTNTSIADGENLVLLVRSHTDEKLLAGVEDRGIGQGRVPDFIEGIRAVRDKFSQEDLLVGIEGVFAGGQQQMMRAKNTTY